MPLCQAVYAVRRDDHSAGVAESLYVTKSFQHKRFDNGWRVDGPPPLVPPHLRRAEPGRAIKYTRHSPFRNRR